MSILKDTSVPDDQVLVTRLRYSPRKQKYTRESATQQGLFLKGPIPLDWLCAAANLKGKALNVALAIQWLVAINKGCPNKLTAQALRIFNVSDDACSDGLKGLESANLIEVSRYAGQRPIIKIKLTRVQQSTGGSPDTECNFGEAGDG